MQRQPPVARSRWGSREGKVTMDTVEHLVDIPSVGFPSWSPRGDALAYLDDQPGAGWRLTVYDLGTAERRAPSERPVAGSRPVWSPDATTIAVVRGNAHGGSDLWLVPAAGAGDERRVAGGPWETRSPSFSPDGRSLAFISGEAGALDVWVVPAAGGEPRRLTAATNPLDEPRWSPRWSPDGRWLAYVSSRSGERNNDDLWLVSPDGERHRQLTTGLLVNTDAAWSPDGRWIAVVGNTENE